MRVCIVGAGVAGLAAARSLARAGAEPTVLEASDHVGGRCETLRADGFVFDTGATSVAPRGLALERAILEELPQEGLVKVEAPVYVHDGARVAPGDPGRGLGGRYCYADGLDQLPRLLAAGLDVRLGAPVRQIEAVAGGLRVEGDRYDAVVVTVPVPEAEPLLGEVGTRRRLTGSRYRPCIAVMLGLAFEAEAPYFALIDRDANVPLTWLSIESIKVPGSRAPSGCSALVAQMSPEYSVRRADDADEVIVHETMVDLRRLLRMDVPAPAFSAVRRWRHSQPEATVSFDAANPPGSRVLLAGDGVAGGRVELAYESGLMAAGRLLEGA